MSAWDHFHTDSAFDENISTHYINSPYCFSIDQEKKESLDLLVDEQEQHSSLIWTLFKEVPVHTQVHPVCIMAVKKYKDGKLKLNIQK